MATKALDTATIFKCLVKSEEALGENRLWLAQNDSQRRLIKLFEVCRLSVPLLDGFETHLRSVVQEDDSISLYLSSKLDKLVLWSGGVAEADSIHVGQKSYPAFRIKSAGFDIYNVEGYQNPLVLLSTRSHDKLCLMMLPETDELGLSETAHDILHRKHGPDWSYGGVIIPKIDFSLQPSLSFLEGASTKTAISLQSAYINKADQEFKFRMDEMGARAIVVTQMEMVIIAHHTPFLGFDKPFLGFFIQGHLANTDAVPVACFWADYDSWKEPAGSLEDL